jgi:hypothetical protein
MANDSTIQDDEQQMMQAQIEQDEQEFELMIEDEHQQYLNILANDFYGSSVTLMTELN